MRTTLRLLMVSLCLMLFLGCQSATTTIQPPFFKPQSQDTQITTMVLEGMLNNETVSDLTIHVETADRMVLLSGYVKTIRQSDTAEAIARKIPGVASVQNQIIVRK
ncbi:MAG: BON domain-containing protein [Legionellales bacterium]|nr:BON domain-containing protein [Legionellales bacterium]